MTNKPLISKEAGESNEEEKRIQLATQSIEGERTVTTSDMSEKTAIPTQNQIGFQATKLLDVDEETANANLIMAFAAKLGVKVFWKKLELGEGEVFALCFPTKHWIPNSENGLTYKKVGKK